MEAIPRWFSLTSGEFQLWVVWLGRWSVVSFWEFYTRDWSFSGSFWLAENSGEVGDGESSWVMIKRCCRTTSYTNVSSNPVDMSDEGGGDTASIHSTEQAITRSPERRPRAEQVKIIQTSILSRGHLLQTLLQFVQVGAPHQEWLKTSSVSLLRSCCPTVSCWSSWPTTCGCVWPWPWAPPPATSCSAGRRPWWWMWAESTVTEIRPGQPVWPPSDVVRRFFTRMCSVECTDTTYNKSHIYTLHVIMSDCVYFVVLHFTFMEGDHKASL